MVPQQQDSPSSSGMPLFGSLLVDKNSSTPYSDATQVKRYFSLVGKSKRDLSFFEREKSKKNSPPVIKKCVFLRNCHRYREENAVGKKHVRRQQNYFDKSRLVNELSNLLIFPQLFSLRFSRLFPNFPLFFHFSHSFREFSTIFPNFSKINFG